VLNQAQWQIGDIEIPSVIDSDTLHSVILSGYSFGKRAFHFKNSWGIWGDRGSGYGWMSFDFVQRYATEVIVANKNSLRLTHLNSRL
jgi:C1A family cysteine protease